MRAATLIPAAVIAGLTLLLGASPVVAKGSANKLAPRTVVLKAAATPTSAARPQPRRAADAQGALSPFLVLDPFSSAMAVLVGGPAPQLAETSPGRAASAPSGKGAPAAKAAPLAPVGR